MAAKKLKEAPSKTDSNILIKDIERGRAIAASMVLELVLELEAQEVTANAAAVVVGSLVSTLLTSCTGSASLERVFNAFFVCLKAADDAGIHSVMTLKDRLEQLKKWKEERDGKN
jgi:hypothetical protein